MQNRIVCAANKLNDGTVVLGVRHFDQHMRNVLMEKYPNRGYLKIGYEEGFVDRFGVFHTREEAWKIASAANQIIRRCGGDDHGDGRLFSENLY